MDVIIDAAVEINQQPFSLERMVTSDISGGGCSFVLPKGKYFFPGIIFDCCLALPYDKGMEFLNVKAKLVRIDLSSSPNRLCCKFIQISESERNQLTQFVLITAFFLLHPIYHNHLINVLGYTFLVMP